MDFDYGIIGGGPAGYTAAMMLAKKGNKVVLFEKDKLGGTCLNKGCIPTKSLLHSSELYYNTLEKAKNIGLDIEVKSFDFSKTAILRDDTVNKLRKGLELVVKNSGAEVVYASAEIKNSNTIIANDDEYNVKNIIIATGSKPKEISNLKYDGKFVLNSDDVLTHSTLPKSVLIVGSGAIGIEWARIYSNFGVEVTIVELQNNLIPNADIEVSKRIERIFKQKKIKFYLNDSIEKIENNNVTLKSGVEISPDFVLVAIGRSPVEFNSDFVENIIGDAADEIQLAHYAIHQAKNLALNIKYEKDLIPSVIYGEPEIAWVGLREQDCDESCTILKTPVSILGKAWCDDATEGFVKLIIKDNLIVGAHIVSKEASALIHEILIAMQNKITLDKLKEICFAHPTFSEVIFELISKI